MKDIINLIGITGEPLYLRAAYNVTAVVAATSGDIKCTEIHMPGVMFRVRNSVEEVVSLLGWKESVKNGQRRAKRQEMSRP